MRISDWSSDVCSSDLAACLLFEERRQVTRPYRVCVPNDKDRRPIGLTRHRLFLLFVAAWLEAVHAKPPLASDNGALGRLEWVDHKHHRDRNTDGDERSHKDVRKLRSEEHTSEIQQLIRTSHTDL